MFRLVTSNDAARLADALGERLAAPRENPLVPARVLVPQAGLRRWLQTCLAERLGVLANIEFTPPAQFAWELLRAAQPGLPRQSPFDVEVLRWHLYALLGERLDGVALAPLCDYLEADGDPLRRYALGLELARVYERMQGYRRKRLLQWERGGNADNWQAELWRRLLPRVGGASRAARVDAWLEAFDPEYPGGAYVAKPAPPGLPPHFACFACANVSPDVLRMLAVAGHHVDVDFFLPLPSREYLGDLPRTRAEVRERLDERSGENPLVLSLGGALSDCIGLLYGYEHVRPDAEIERFDAELDRSTLLGRVRDDILKHALPGGAAKLAEPDASLQFHACHTPLREVQVLHDALLAMFESDASLQPRDVAVMMPDVAAYRPAIEAVFGGMAHADARWLPFNLGDLGVASTHPAAQAFLRLLEAPASRWELDEILDALDVPGTRRRFGLDADDLASMQRELHAAGVRWGEDEHARKDCGAYREYSWAFGLDRLLTGFAAGDTPVLLQGIAPLDAGAATIARLDAVYALLEAWRRVRELSRQALSPLRWQERLNALFDEVYRPDVHDPDELRAIERIRGALEQLVADTAAAGPGPPLPWAEVCAFLRERLADPDPRQRLFTGGITFCGMVPLRVVPFRVICLLGMDEASFPRREAGSLDPLLADRRAGHPERGDRNLRADDRVLFLQLVAAARDVLYVSWVGCDPHTNTALPPSGVVADLIHVLRAHYLQPPVDMDGPDPPLKLLPRVEPLHPFDARLFDPKGPRSFAREWRHAATRARAAVATPPFHVGAATATAVAADAEAVDLETLLRFFRNPARGYLVDGLGIALPCEEDADLALEPLQLDALLRYRLTETLLARGGRDLECEARDLRARGELPPGELAVAALRNVGERSEALRGAIDAFTGGAPALPDATHSVTLPDGSRVSGTLRNLHPAGLLHASPGKLDGKRALAAHIDALFAVAVGAASACRLITLDQDTARSFDLRLGSRADATARLGELVAAYRRGLREPLPLLTRISWDCLKRDRMHATPASRDEFIAALRKKFARRDDDNESGSRSEFDDPAVRIAWRGREPPGGDAAAWFEAAAQWFPELQPAGRHA